MIVVGLGFRQSATVASLRDALGQVAGEHRLDALATAGDKAGAECMIALGQALVLPVIGVLEAEMLAAEVLTRTPVVQAKRGTGSVAEAAALVAAGPGARLIGARVVSGDRLATAALAVGLGEAP